MTKRVKFRRSMVEFYLFCGKISNVGLDEFTFDYGGTII